MNQKPPSSENIATFAGGCFWCTEAVFQRLKGVKSVIPGYAGGDVPDPSYEQVCTGSTGHAEAIQVTFDSQLIDFSTLLSVFFSTHNPTTPNRQGNDVGSQYRSAIFYHTPEQLQQTQEYMAKLEEDEVFPSPIVTQVLPFTNFYPAEEYHHNYYRQNQAQTYCQVVINPKLDKLKKDYASLLQ